MNEEIFAEAIEDTEAVEVTTETTDAAIEDDWYSDGYTESPESESEMEDADSENSEADQQEETETVVDDTPAEETATPAEKQEAQQTEEQTEEQKTEAADQLFTLKHLDEVREVSRDEVIALAQKGLDYDRKTQKLSDTISEYEEFLDGLVPEGLTRAQFMDSVRARVYMAAQKAEGKEISEAQALFKIQQDRADKKRSAEAEAAEAANREKQAAEDKRKNMLLSFVEAYPGVKAENIPAEVWQETQKTGDLVGAWAKHENTLLKREKAELEKRIETFEQNAKNAQRSTGSRKSAGKPNEESDFDVAWYDGT